MCHRTACGGVSRIRFSLHPFDSSLDCVYSRYGVRPSGQKQGAVGLASTVSTASGLTCISWPGIRHCLQAHQVAMGQTTSSYTTIPVTIQVQYEDDLPNGMYTQGTVGT